MSSFNDQAEYLRKKKEEILAKKKSQVSNSNKSSTAPKAVPFANDGSFMEKFKAMQKSQKIKQEPMEKPATKGHGNRLKPSSSTTIVQKPLQDVARIFKEEPVDSTSSSSEMDFELARELAERVNKEGVQAEIMARIQGRTDPRYQFLFNDTSPVAQFYQTQLQNLKREKEAVSTSNIPDIKPTSSSSSSEIPANFMSEFEKAKALVRAKAAALINGGPAAVATVVTEEEKRRQREIEEQKMMNEIYMKVIQQQMTAATNATRKRKRNKEKDKDKPKYEYDSDEDVDGGTWEHKKRQTEMQKTAEKALELTDSAKGKHHISDFLPPDELEKFIEKVKAVKEGREVDFSDYAKYKLGEDNIGYKMLQKAGWQEGSGLGSKGEGITAPINKGKTSFDNGGIGTEKIAEVKKDDDDFEVYRKRMMLAYKFRPNPLNNPRRPYYE